MIFLAHGLGTALTKYCLANQYEYHETITKKTTGVIFLDSWSDSTDRDSITEFVDGWIRDAPNPSGHDELRPIQQDNTSPDNVVDQRRSVQASERKAKEEFVDLLLQVDENFRAIMNPGRKRNGQLAIDGRVLQLSWLGPPPRRRVGFFETKIPDFRLNEKLTVSKRVSQLLALPAPIFRTPSIRKINEDTKNALTNILNLFRDASQLRDGLPPELRGFMYFTGEHDNTKLITASPATDAYFPLIPVAEQDEEDMERVVQPASPGRTSRRSLSRSRRRSIGSRSTEKPILRNSQSPSRPVEETIQTRERSEFNNESSPGESPSPPSRMEAATRGLYQKFVDMNATPQPTERKDRISSTEALSRLTTKAASYVELGELDNADKVYEQTIRLLQALAPGDSHLFVLHLRRAKVWHEMGRYEEAKTYFSSIHEAADSVETRSQAMAPVSDSLARDLDWYRVLTRFRLGDHVTVDKILAEYLEHVSVTRIVNEPSLPWDENIQIVFRFKRILALNKAKMGHFGEAQEQIDQLHIIVRKLDHFILTDGTERQQQRHYDGHQHLSSQHQKPVTQAANDTHHPRKASALLAYTSALVFLLRGQHKTALTESREAVELLGKTSGAGSLDALEARSLEACLLAYNCQPEKAEAACKESLRCVSRNFGAQHPLSLETIDVLVFILRRQARLSEALVTAQGLCRQCEQVLGPGRPQTRQSKSQLASIHLSNGNYRDAVKLLEEIAPKTAEEYGSPSTLRYQAELALALFRLGKFDAAAATIRRAILAQKILFSNTTRDSGAHEEERPDVNFERELDELVRDLQAKPGQPSRYMVHPDLLRSLEVLAHVTSRTDLARAVRHLDLVLELRQGGRAELAGDQHATAKTRLDAILMRRELGAGDYGYPQAERDLHELVGALQRALGPYHADTAAARSELLLARAVLGRAPRLSLTKLGALKRQQKVEVGRSHPDTLRTRLAILVVQLLLGDAQQAAATCRSLLAALRAPEVRAQRLAEALTMEERVAVLYANQGRFGECRGILEGMVAGLEGELAPQVKELGLDDMVARVKDLLDKIGSYEASV